MNGIEVKDVSKRYGKTITLDKVSFSVPKGARYGLIGPDGAGKTSMFRILTTLLLPSEGQAFVDELDCIKQLSAIRKRVGYMPGKFSLYQDLTVEENLKFFATLFGTTIEASYDSVKEIYSQIERFKHRKAGALSGGMKQKLALSCALIHQPSVLFLDEPTTGVDPVSRTEFWDMLDHLRDRGITILASTPYLNEVRRCDKVVFLSEGKVQGIDTPEVILEQFKAIFNPPGLKKEAHEQGQGMSDNIGQCQKLSDNVRRTSRKTPQKPAAGPEQKPVIIVQDLVKTFGTFHAVNHISFSVRRGEIFGFLGANGAGKTTAMRILAGLSQPSGGKATVAGYDAATEYEQIKKHIGYMSQKFSLYEDLTVKENMRLFGGIYGMTDKAIREKTIQVLEQLAFTQYANTLVADLPLGRKQKLAFSVSIFHNPEVVFLDEPTGGVDPATRRQFWQLIYDATQQGITVFVTTHYMDEAEYCDRISIMVDGEIRALGSADELKQQFECETMDEVFTLLARKAKRE